MNILFLDTETSPNQVDTWGLRDQNIAINQIRKPGALLCWAAKWYGRPGDEVIFDGVNENTRRQMVKHLHALYSDADLVVGYNSISFDTKVVNKEFLLEGFAPPPPFKQLDLLRTMRKKFRFASNKLDFVSQQLELGAKTAHHGHGLWTACEQGDQEAWALMKRYNMQDVLLTEKLYVRLRPWFGSDHPNQNVYELNGHACPTCGSKHVQARGKAYSKTQTYRRYQCLEPGCLSWSQDPITLGVKTRYERLQMLRAA